MRHRLSPVISDRPDPPDTQHPQHPQHLHLKEHR
jgi:hypothetical protein